MSLKYLLEAKQKLNNISEKINSGKTLVEAINQTQPPILDITKKYELLEQYENTINGIEIIAEFLKDKTITDIMINNDGQIWVENQGGIHPTNKQLKGQEVKTLAIKLASLCEKRLDEACPIVDGSLPNGIRFNAILDPISLGNTCISFRIKNKTTYTFEEIFIQNSIHYGIKNIVEKIIKSKISFIISGATGTGKTTLLSALTTLFEENERTLFIEEINEIQTTHKNSVFLQSRNKNIENAGEISLSQLVHAAMRMRPDRIILGECRGQEIKDILNAFNTGHEGGITTIHSNSVKDIPSRILALGKLANLDADTIMYQTVSAIKIAIHLGRRKIDGKIQRWVKEIGIFDIENNRLVCKPCLQVTQSGKILYTENYNQLKETLENVEYNN